MRCVMFTATATRKNRSDTSDQYREKNAQLRTRAPRLFGSQIQFATNAATSIEP